MGGMAAQIPIKGDAEANEAAPCRRSRDDKRREALAGHDGTWVAHPGLVPIARRIFDEIMPAPNQLDRRQRAESITAAELLEVPPGPITEAGLRQNIHVGVHYLEAWLRGIGLRAALQPDGRRRDGRDLAHAGVAVAAPRGRARRRPAARRARSTKAVRDEELAGIRAEAGDAPGAPGASSGPRPFSTRSRPRPRFRTF